jgi:hypothetical protein
MRQFQVEVQSGRPDQRGQERYALHKISRKNLQQVLLYFIRRELSEA